MSVLQTVVKTIMNMGPVVMLPILLTILGLIFRMPFQRALRAGVTVGIGFQGISLVVSFLIGVMKPAALALASGYVAKFSSIIDVGWVTWAGAIWAAPFAIICVPLIFALNVVMILVGYTRTLNVDVWNFLHTMGVGAVVYFLGGHNFWVAVAVTLICNMILWKLADRMAPHWQEYFEIPGSTCTCFCHLTAQWPLAWLVDKVISAIPGLRDIDLSPESIRQSRLSFFAEPVFQGLICGFVLSLLARLPLEGVLATTVGLAATMVLLPRMATMLMEGLKPIADAAQVFAKRSLKGRTINIGIDIAAGLGDPTIISCLSLMVPLTIGIALILPGNSFFPTLWFAGSIYGIVLISMTHKGNLFRVLITETLRTVLALWLVTWTASMSTNIMAGAGVLEKTPGVEAVAGDCMATTVNVLGVLFAKLIGG